MLSSAYLFFRVNRFDIKGKRILEIHEKYYTGDIGLKNILVGYKPEYISGHLENIVYLELLSRGYSVEIGKLYDKEVDFIATLGDQRNYIQVAYLLADQKTIDREFGVLERISDNYQKIVLSMDKVPIGTRNGIRWIHLTDFLLTP
jgi:predicted AAA+ superfamily ATPase